MVAAIDCAHEKNTRLCRQFDNMLYPSVRYFPPNYEKRPQNHGTGIEHPPLHNNLVMLILIKYLRHQVGQILSLRATVREMKYSRIFR